MMQPDFQTFKMLAKQGNLVPVYDVYTADLLTPVGAYLRVARNAKYSFFARKQVEGGENIARYHVCRGESRRSVSLARALLHPRIGRGRSRISRTIQSSTFAGSPNGINLCGISGAPAVNRWRDPVISAYDMVRLVERIPDTGRDDVGLDDCVMMFYLGLVAFDHVQHRVCVILETCSPRAQATCGLNMTRRSVIFVFVIRAGCSKRHYTPRARRAARRLVARRVEYDEATVCLRGAQGEVLYSCRRCLSSCREPALFSRIESGSV